MAVIKCLAPLRGVASTGEMLRRWRSIMPTMKEAWLSQEGWVGSTMKVVAGYENEEVVRLSVYQPENIMWYVEIAAIMLCNGSEENFLRQTSITMLFKNILSNVWSGVCVCIKMVCHLNQISFVEIIYQSENQRIIINGVMAIMALVKQCRRRRPI